MLNLERLRTLDALARHGSVSGAAEGLHVTTSAVSQQMAKLEREVGQRLLAKNGRGVRLTDAGRLLAEHAARILSQVELAQADLEAQRGQVVGELRLAAFPTAVRGLFPALFRALRDDHPALRVRSRELEPELAIHAVVRGDADLAVVLDWYNKPLPVPEGLARAAILDDPVEVALPDDHPLAGRDEIDLRELAEEPWVVWPEGEFCHEWLLYTLRANGIEPQIAHRAGEHPHPTGAGSSRVGCLHRTPARPRPDAGPDADGPRAPPGPPERLRRMACGRRPAAVDQGGGRGAPGGGGRVRFGVNGRPPPCPGTGPGGRCASGGAPAGVYPNLRKSQDAIASGVRRSQACLPSCGISSMPKFLRANRRSTSTSSGTGSPVRGASPTNSTVPDSSAPRSSPYSSPASTTTAQRGSRRSADHRLLRVIE